jgi:hypothetical protein
VTPSGVRDGDPAALAGLCARRGPAVLAYCRHVAGDAAAAAAAAEAFGQFRAQVVAADDPASLNPEALLISATRHAAARHTTVVATGLCAEVPTLLAGRADRSISAANVEFLKGHLEVCWTCRAPVARFEAAERAYRDPPDGPVPPDAAEAIVAALAAAAPVRTAGEEPPPEVIPLPAPTSNGNGHHDPVANVPDEPDATGEPDVPTTEHRTLDEFAPRVRSSNGDRGARRDQRERERHGALAAVRGTLGAGAARALETRRTGTGGREASRRAAPQPRSGSGTSLPRPERPVRPSPVRGGRRERSTVRPSVVLPVVLVVGAVFVALVVAGVFGADDPASSSRSVAPPRPAAAPATTTAPEVVVVPGAGNAGASASDVERAKAGARAQSQRQAAPDRATATTPATPPPPPPPPAANATPPAAPAPEPPATPSGGAQPKVKPKPKPKAAPKPAPRHKDKARIDADNGATGVEPRLPAQKSKVPDLAPPPEPSTPTPQPPG